MRYSNFFYNVTGEEAERLLRVYGANGDFLARPSESAQENFSLSIRHGDGVTHVKIFSDEDRNLICGATDQRFRLLSEVIEHYKDNPFTLQPANQNRQSIPFILNKPLSIPVDERAFVEVRKPALQPYFHSGITGQEANELLRSQKPGTFLIRDSQRTPGGYVISIAVKDGGDSAVHVHVFHDLSTGIVGIPGMGENFMNLDELVRHYGNGNTPMVSEANQRVVYMFEPLKTTSFPADAISLRIKQLEKYSPLNHKYFSEEFNSIVNNDERHSRREGRKEINADKNRYKNIVPYDHTRVVLVESSENPDRFENDYINGNYITIEPNRPIMSFAFTKKFISTQGCLETTVIDFWRMIWQENSRVIIMATKDSEGGRPKCHVYWPALGKEASFGGYKVRTDVEKKIRDSANSEIYVKRTLSLWRDSESSKREIEHLQFVSWPDHGCPEEPDEVLNFLEDAHEVYQQKGEDQGPVVVHCSAGIGRTGALITIDAILNQIRALGFTCPIDIPRTLQYLRNQRDGFVQSGEQYEIIYRVINSYVRRNSKAMVR